MISSTSFIICERHLIHSGNVLVSQVWDYYYCSFFFVSAIIILLWLILSYSEFRRGTGLDEYIRQSLKVQKMQYFPRRKLLPNKIRSYFCGKLSFEYLHIMCNAILKCWKTIIFLRKVRRSKFMSSIFVQCIWYLCFQQARTDST